MKKYQRIDTSQFHKTSGLARDLQGNRDLQRERAQYGKRQAPKPFSLTIINRTQGRKIVYG